MADSTLIKTASKEESTTRILAFAVRFLPIVTTVGALIMVGLAFAILWGARWLANAGVVRDFLINVAAGLVEIAIGGVLGVVVAWAVAKNKLQQISRPVLALIQRLRIDGKLEPDAARRAVVCAVALISESNVSKEIEAREGEAMTDCPICSKDVEEKMDRCVHCQLPKTIWRDDKLLEVHLANLSAK